MRRFRDFRRRRQERKGYHVRRTIYTNNVEANSHIRYPPNYISTTRYNIITFLPKNLWEQFHRVANVFFVVMMILSVTPISPVIPGPQVAAVVAILGFQAIKDAYVDWKRHKQDKEINGRTVEVLRGSSEFEEIRWDQLKVGDIVKVSCNTEVPADLLLLSSAKENGQCFLETANLDGESNLKLRSSHPITADHRTPEKLHDLKIEIDADEPLVKLYEWDGSIVMGEEEAPLTIENFLHRGTTLRNTEYVYGLVMYTGHQTKFMLNISSPRHKTSKLESILNKCILMILLFLVIMCVVSAVIGVVVYQYDIARDHWYIIFDDEKGEFADTILAMLTFVVVYHNLVPLSLYVNLEATRLVQAKMMEADWRMFDKTRNRSVIARSTNLMEELGQIDYIFSDKTGTLTRNEMVFRVCSVGGEQFGEIPDLKQAGEFDEEEYFSHVVEGDEGLAEMEEMRKTKMEAEPFDDRVFDFLGPEKKSSKKQPKDGEYNDNEVVEVEEAGYLAKGNNEIANLFLSMAICNSVVPAEMSGKIVYQSSSPDETALVIGAKKANYTLVSRSVDDCVVDVFGDEQTFETLAVNEFTSERKRMSVVVRMPDGTIQLFLKGADDAVFERCSSGKDGAAQSTDQFAEGGLRTLVFAQKEIPEAEFNDWAENHWNPARLATENRKQAMLACAEMLEKDMRVVGTTGIEDRLQDDVPRTIDDLMKANIKVWVLTGDKGQTAINIAEACCLIKPSYDLLRIKAEDEKELEGVQNAILEGIQSAEARETALVIDGRALAHALELGMEDDLVALTSACQSVVCCRSTPVQKQQMVALMKEKLNIRTLAIGDGANDVAMIQSAHVGVGVMGNEGMQAVMSSDFVIGQFRFLRRLLLLHGRWNYMRIGYMVCYVVYKNVILTLIPFWFAFFSMWSGEIYLDPWIRTMWNFLFTAAPIFVYSILEQDLPAEMVLRHPQLYIEGQKNHSFNGIKFFMWFVFSLWDGAVCFFATIGTAYGLGLAVSDDGRNGDYWHTSTLTYTVMCIAANLHIILHTRYWNCITHWAYWFSTLSWFVFALLYCTEVCIFLESPYMFNVINHLYETPLFWLCIPVVPFMAVLPDAMILYIRRTYWPKPYHILQEVCQTQEWKDEHPETGKWCVEKGDCCCRCCERCWCDNCI